MENMEIIYGNDDVTVEIMYLNGMKDKFPMSMLEESVYADRYEYVRKNE